jgi:(1->4)-alpha-D-glucan 1-alpha-D-glucosylmutase
MKLFESVRSGVSSHDASTASRLLETPEDGRIKLYLIWKTLCQRQQQPSLFEQGEYLPLAVAGAKAGHIIAFARKLDGASAIIIAPRLIATLLNDADLPPLGAKIWGDTHVLFPYDSGEGCQNVFTGKDVELMPADDHSTGQRKITVSDALAEFPVALCLLNAH